MKALLLRIGLFVLINILIIISILEYLHQRDLRLKVHQSVTESVVLGLDKGKKYNWLIMGASHGRNLVRGQNFFALQQASHKMIACIAQSAAGVVPEFFWLKYFYQQQNQVDTIIYVLDPFVFFTPKWNDDLQFLSNEPFRWNLLKPVIFSAISKDVKFNYVKSKVEKPWLSRRGVFIQDENGSLKSRDTSAVRKRIESLYPDAYSIVAFTKYNAVLQDIMNCAAAHHSKIIFILPPTLLGETPGYFELINILRNFQDKGQATYFDFTNALKDPALYYNHDHLNPAGMRQYISKCLSLVF